MSQQNDLVDTWWVSEALGVTIKTVCQWARRGYFPDPVQRPSDHHPSKPWLWRHDDMAAWMEEQDNYVDAEYIGECLGVSAKTVLAWHRKGQMPPHTKVGHRYAWHWDVAKQWMLDNFDIEFQDDEDDSGASAESEDDEDDAA